MRLLLLFLLQFSLVHCRTLDTNELYLDLNGFPRGSLLTFFFKADSTDNHAIVIDFYEDFKNDNSQHLHFRADLNQNLLVSNYRVKGRWESEVKATPWLTEALIKETQETKNRWIRFDLYRIDETNFLVFLQGFLASFSKNPRVLKVTESLTSVHIKPYACATTLCPRYKDTNPNIDTKNVYISIKEPNPLTPNPEWVLGALDPVKVKARRNTKVGLAKLEHFRVGFTFAIGALMVSNDVHHENWASLFFWNKKKTWAFEILNKWFDNDNEGGPKRVYLYLNIVENYVPEWWIRATKVQKCTGTSDTTTSTDLVHLKLTRPDKNKIEMRAYYRDEKHSGIVCTLPITDEEAKYLDDEIIVEGADSAVILNISIDD